MYAYGWDEETGGLLLNSTFLEMSKEPRPVYAPELDILGFDKHFKYEQQTDYPYMWAESNNYIYRGKLIAKTKGGTIYTAPELQIVDTEMSGKDLQPVNIELMVKKNSHILDSFVQYCIKKLYAAYLKYRKKVDIFHVSYSGGKDSEVTLDLVQRALPHDAFVVIFGDTCMEFPDTYKAVYKAEQRCKELGIKFYRARSHLSPEESWKIFGPPSTTIRWCCSVHKTAPQLLKLREILGYSDFKEMAFVGIRGDESMRRAGYSYISVGTKHKGQYSCNPILSWNSAEVFLYLYQQNLYINNAYKKGNGRAGCLVCPMSGDKSDFMRHANYPAEVNKFIDLVKLTNTLTLATPEDKQRYFETGGWKVRKNGLFLSCAEEKYKDKCIDNKIEIEVQNPNVDWKEWIKTIGYLDEIEKNRYLIKSSQCSIEFELKYNKRGYNVTIFNIDSSEKTILLKQLKSVFRKSAFCILCRECEADCPHGYLSMADGKLKISDDCLKCGSCHKPYLGCLVSASQYMPKGVEMKTKSIDCYGEHAPKFEWFEQLFEMKDQFINENRLGSEMISKFKKFLKHAEIYNNKYELTPMANLLFDLGLEDERTWAIMLVTLCYTPEFNWFAKNIHSEKTYSREQMVSMLQAEDVKPRGCDSIRRAYKKILALPFGTKIGFGSYYTEDKNEYYARGTWEDPDSLVILYALYKFAEECENYYEFTLARLFNDKIESDGISPAQIFSIGSDVLIPILKGLSVDYPEFISVSFTHNLDNINLRHNKSSADVLALFHS